MQFQLLQPASRSAVLPCSTGPHMSAQPGPAAPPHERPLARSISCCSDDQPLVTAPQPSATTLLVLRLVGCALTQSGSPGKPL